MAPRRFSQCKWQRGSRSQNDNAHVFIAIYRRAEQAAILWLLYWIDEIWWSFIIGRGASEFHGPIRSIRAVATNHSYLCPKFLNAIALFIAALKLVLINLSRSWIMTWMFARLNQQCYPIKYPNAKMHSKNVSFLCANCSSVDQKTNFALFEKHFLFNISYYFLFDFSFHWFCGGKKIALITIAYSSSGSKTITTNRCIIIV